MDYPTARQQIKTGDVLAIRGRTAFARLTALVQRLGGLGALSGVSHMGVGWWIDGRLYSVEMDGQHNVLRPLSQHIAAGCAVEVYRNPVPEAMAAQFERATATAIPYSVMDLILIAARLLLGAQTPPDRGGLVCSTFVTRWLQWAGWLWPMGLPSMPAPAEVCRALGLPRITIEQNTKQSTHA